MTYFVYVIETITRDRRYVGITKNVTLRIIQHNKGMNFSTKGYRPWKLLFAEEFENRLLARQREKYLKSGIGREYINKKWPRSSTE